MKGKKIASSPRYIASLQLLDDWKRVASEVCSHNNANHQREMRFYKLMVIQVKMI